MALTLVVEDGTGVATANAYLTLAEADAFAEEELYLDAWVAADEDRRTAALVLATRLMDERLVWAGVPATTTQVLGWPRSDVYDRLAVLVADDAVPEDVKRGTFRTAVALLADDRVKLSEEGAVVSLTVGPLSLVRASGGNPGRSTAVIPPDVDRGLGPLLNSRVALRA